MTDLPAEPTHAAPNPSDERVGVIEGDRVCVQCGFNLLGQAVIRERHYQALIVRCPECSAVAALHEYPLLGRWAKRLALLLAAAWLAVIIAGIALYSVTFYGLGVSTVQSGSVELGEVIGDHYIEWQQEMIERHRDDPSAPAALMQYPHLSQMLTQVQAGQNIYYGSGYVDPIWLEEQDEQSFLRESGGLAGAVVSARLIEWIFFGLIAFAMGSAMAIALLHQPPWRVAAIALLPITTGAIVMLYFTPEPNPWGTSAYWTMFVAQRMLWIRLGLVAMTFYLTCTWVGIFAGRPLARAVIRGAIPPRLRAPLTVLWTSKGLPPPRTRQ